MAITSEQREIINNIHDLLEELTDEIAADSSSEGGVLWDCYIQISSIIL